MALTKDFSNWFRIKIRDAIRNPDTSLGENLHASKSVVSQRASIVPDIRILVANVLLSEPPFGTSLQHSIFNTTVYLSGQDGKPYVYDYIPIIVEECGNILKGEGMWQMDPVTKICLIVTTGTNSPGMFTALSG
jgi:hypothetical protein